MERTGADQRMRRLRLEPAIQLLQPRQDAAKPEDRILTLSRPAAVRRSSLHRDLYPREAFVTHRNLEIGRLGHDRRVGTPGFDERIRADARMLLVDDTRDNDAS